MLKFAIELSFERLIIFMQKAFEFMHFYSFKGPRHENLGKGPEKRHRIVKGMELECNRSYSPAYMTNKIRRRPKSPRKLSLVKFDHSSLPRRYWQKYPFRADRVLIFIGEISNMKGHCIVADYKTGRLYSGYHTNNFVELRQDET